MDAKSTEDTDSSRKTTDGNTKMKGVHFTIHPDRHEELTQFADDIGLSFSALLRRGAERMRSREENGGTTPELQPLVTDIEMMRETLADHDECLEQIREEQSQLLELVQESGPVADTETHSDEWIGQELHSLLEDGGPLTIPDLVDRTEFDREQVQRGIGHLQGVFSIEDVETDYGAVAWRCK